MSNLVTVSFCLQGSDVKISTPVEALDKILVALNVLPARKEPTVQPRTKQPRIKYALVDLGLSEQSKEEFRRCYSAQKRRTQNELVLLIMTLLEKFTGKPYASLAEIHSGIVLVGAKEPVCLATVISNLRRQGKIKGSRFTGYRICHSEPIAESSGAGENSESPTEALSAENVVTTGESNETLESVSIE